MPKKNMPRPVCRICGSPSLAKELCRKHYDASRKIPRFAIARDIQVEVETLARVRKWMIPLTINELMRAGLKWFKEREQVADKYDLRKS